MVNNMGTPGYPEGVPHWSIKTLLAHKLKVALKPKPSRNYAGLLPSEFRNLTIGEGVLERHGKDVADALKDSLENVTTRLDSHPPYSYVAYMETPHNGCEGGLMLVDILRGHRGGQVMQESPYAGFIPDIAIYPPNESDPSCCIEVVDTSLPSERKLIEMTRRGVEVYQVSTKESNPLVVLEEPVVVTPLVTSRCGKVLRQEIEKVYAFWEKATDPFVGIRFYPSGTQEYLVGEQQDRYGGPGWSYGDNEVRGLVRLDAAWPSLAHVSPAGRPRTITRELFVDYLMYSKTAMIVDAHKREEGLEDSPLGHVRLTHLESIIIKNINDLLHMVRFP